MHILYKFQWLFFTCIFIVFSIYKQKRSHDDWLPVYCNLDLGFMFSDYCFCTVDAVFNCRDNKWLAVFHVSTNRYLISVFKAVKLDAVIGNSAFFYDPVFGIEGSWMAIIVQVLAIIAIAVVGNNKKVRCP